MKKLVSLLIVLFMMTVPVFAENETESNSAFDLTAMSIEELVALQNAIDVELSSRTSGDYVILPKGAYEVGVDIGAGKYLLTNTDADQETKLLYYDTREDQKEDNIQDWKTVDAGSQRTLELEDGEIFFVQDALLVEKAGTFFMD